MSDGKNDARPASDSGWALPAAGREARRPHRVRDDARDDQEDQRQRQLESELHAVLAWLKRSDQWRRYAPRWARLHWQWGLALCYLGRKDEAAGEFALAKEYSA